MTLWFIEGFDHYSPHTPGSPGTYYNGGDFLKKWTGIVGGSGTNFGAASTVNGLCVDPYAARQAPGQGFIIGGTALKPYKTRPGSNVDTFVFGCAVLFATSVPSTNAFMGFYDGVVEQVSLRGDGAGHITFTRNGTVLATSTNVVSVGVWYYFEMKAKINNTTGTYEVRVNGSATGWIPAATGANTRNTANNQCTGVFIGSTVNNVQTLFDDLYCLDTGGSVNNDFLGPQVVMTLRPSEPGNSNQFSPNYGKNFANVNDIVPDADQTFNHSATAGHIDTFKMTDAPISSGAIAGVQHVIYAKQDAGAQRVIAPVQHDGGGDHVGTSVNLSASYQFILEIDEVDPNTSAAYTIADLAAAEFGYKLIS